MNIETKIKTEVQKKNAIEFDKQNLIGKGAYAEVYSHDIGNTSVAVKCFQNQDAYYAEKEGEVLEQIQMIAKDCPGIFSYYGMKKLDITIKNQNKNFKGNCLFLQACEGNLTKIPRFPKNEIFNLLSQLSLSLFCLHTNGCSHSDLKPSNILYNEDQQQFKYYLADFGVSKFLQAQLNASYYQQSSVEGTPYYFSPELQAIYKQGLPEGEYNPLSSDIFVLGLICLEQLIGNQYVFRLNQTYDKEDQYNKELQKIKAELLKLDEFQQQSQNSLLNMLLEMVSYDRKSRPQAIEICQKLIQAEQFQIDALDTQNMKALIKQLILSFKPEKQNSQQQQQIPAKFAQQFKNIQPEESKLASIPQKANQAIIQLPIQKIQKAIKIPTFESSIIGNQFPSTLIGSLFEDSNIFLEKIHSQTITQQFDVKKFHLDCDKKGSTLVIFKSSEEPNSFFGGMAIPDWQSPDDWEYYNNPADKQSWLFKVELEGKKINLHQWKGINKQYAISCHKNGGPVFGYYGGLLGRLEGLEYLGLGELFGSCLPFNNRYYQKQDLAQQLNNENNLLCQLSKTININCPTKVIGKIMNENRVTFKLNECEVFRIKK